MKSITLTQILFGVLLGVITLTDGCGLAPPAWTADEKANVAHFFNSLEANEFAIRISNSGGPFSVFSENERADFLRLKSLALAEAKLVRDDVLAKAYSNLPAKYRRLYQRSLELQIRNLEIGDIKAEVEGASLHDLWVDWFNTNKHLIKIPK